MLFSSNLFLFLYLPAVLLTYYLVPRVLRNPVLLLFSLLFYGWGEPIYLFLMIGDILLNYVCGYIIHTRQEKGQRGTGALVAGVALNLLLLGYFKYAGFLLGSLVPAVPLPIGISFYIFQSMSYIIDVYRQDAPVQKYPLTFGTYVTLFPQLIAGPIVRYIDVARELENRTHSMEKFCDGMRRFLVGLGKKVLIADGLALFISRFRDCAEPSVLFYWAYAVAFSLHIYFDFSGYSDMAIGLGRIFGFHFLENFNYPYLSRSVSEFWRRWHMSLGSWFRDYVYIPLGGSRVKPARWVLNILAVWMLTGLWHGASWNFVIWGLLYAVLLLAERLIPGMKKLGAFYTFPVVMLGFVVFNATDLAQAAADIGAMFGFAGIPLVTAETLYYLRSFALLFVLGIIGATPVVRRAARKAGESKAGSALELLMMVGLLLACTAYLVDGSFSPFLYFRF